MKNRILSAFATVLFMGSLMSVAPVEVQNENYDDFGCASNCNRKTRNLVIAMADFANVDPNTFVQNGFYVSAYAQCYNNECQ